MNETQNPAQPVPEMHPAAGATAAGAAPGTGAPPSLEAQLAELQARHSELSDSFLRAKAEAENTRRRADERGPHHREASGASNGGLSG